MCTFTILFIASTHTHTHTHTYTPECKCYQGRDFFIWFTAVFQASRIVPGYRRCSISIAERICYGSLGWYSSLNNYIIIIFACHYQRYLHLLTSGIWVGFLQILTMLMWNPFIPTRDSLCFPTKQNLLLLNCRRIIPTTQQQQKTNNSIKNGQRASLVAQWLRIRLPMQGTRVQALVWEDPTCHGATKPMCHKYWACALELVSHNYWARVPQLLKPTCLEPVLHDEKPPQWEARARRK